jgi:hypothetical protein
MFGRTLGNGIVKSIVFGLTVTFIAVLQGFEAQATPEGVARPPPARWLWPRFRCWVWISS